MTIINAKPEDLEEGGWLECVNAGGFIFYTVGNKYVVERPETGRDLRIKNNAGVAMLSPCQNRSIATWKYHPPEIKQMTKYRIYQDGEWHAEYQTDVCTWKPVESMRTRGFLDAHPVTYSSEEAAEKACKRHAAEQKALEKRIKESEEQKASTLREFEL